MKACHISFAIVITFIVSSECNIYYLDDICRISNLNSREDLWISVPSVGLQSTGEVKSSRRGTYSLGRNCSFKITSVYGLIINVRQVQFRPGCHDYIKISDGKRSIALCGSKNDLDENMQYYGKSIRIHYFTHAGGRATDNLEGVSMIYTATAGLPCDTLRNFLCDNGYCIYKGFICDGYNNCGDYSDERACLKTSTRTGH
ncbi:uncharacterized protein LOC118190981 [Stegodyphus dumicola]|uniref:uncharacterized protein LOC118190981 n=1 Tax=Stegodyphus dumicola TaxID=202533 RepID=UPI0015B189F4|nr:uncharacterized protein LOC118190981 [Stegodyphus dumicola]